MAKKILIVDDDRSSRKLIQSYFESSGYKAEAISDGSQVLSAIEKDRPDAIVMDLLMPGVGGSDAVAKLQRSEIAKNIPVLFLTAVNFNDGMTNGGFDVKVGDLTYVTLHKPADKRQIL